MLRTILTILLALPSFLFALPLAIAGMTLHAFAWCVRAVARLFQPAFVPWPELIRFDPLLGWRACSDLDTYYLADGDDVFKLETDADGWPGRATLDDSEIVVIGDSFAFGYGVDTGRAFSAVDPSLKIKAMGVMGYSLVQGVLLMEELGSRLAGKTVVWFVFPENDLVDGLMPNVRKYRSPFLKWQARKGEWEIVAEHLSPAPWECSLMSNRRGVFGRVHVPGAVSDRVFSASEYLLDRAAAACGKAGATLAVMTIPHPMELEAGLERLRTVCREDPAFEPETPDRRIGRHCRQLEIPFLSARDFLTLDDYKAREGVHWNNRGHRRVAQELKKFCSSISPAPPRREPPLKKVSAGS